MKYSIIILSAIVFFSACNNEEKKENTEETKTSEPLTITIEPNAAADVHYLWQVEPDSSSGKLRMKRKQPLSPDSLNSSFIINYLNVSYPGIQLVFDKISTDTIFVKINKSRYLTAQIGSTGADIYMTEATYNLCELKNINYVDFNFKEGDHAAPGTYSKTDFINVLK